ISSGSLAAWRRHGRLRHARSRQNASRVFLAVIDPCIRGLEALGYVDGKTVHLEYRDAEGNYGRFSELADELARLNSDVIFSFGGDTAPAIKKATTRVCTRIIY